MIAREGPPLEPGRIHLEPLDASNASDLAAIQAIYQSEFPASERKPASYLAETAMRDDSSVFCAVVEGQIIGFALLRGLVSADAQLLEYMAISQQHQSSGYGREMLDLVTGAATVSTIAEVERPIELDGASIEARRVRFYLRAGFRIVASFTYRMPQVGAEDPPAMRLMIHRYPASSINKLQLRHLVDVIYHEVYAMPFYPDFADDLPGFFELSDGEGS